MSDLSDLIAEMDRDEENRKIEDEKYFQVSDEKFQEMQRRLQLLKEENKRQMDIIMNSLDELIANKTVIDKALENADEIEPIINDDNLSIVDLLAKVTGYMNDSEMKNEIREMTNNLSLMHNTPEDDVTMNDVEKLDSENVSEVTPDIKDCEEKSETEEVSKNEDTEVKSKVEIEKKEKENEAVSQNEDSEVKSKVESEKSKKETEEVSKNEDTEVKSKVESEKKEKETELCDSTKLLEKLNVGSTDDNSEDPIVSDEAK